MELSLRPAETGDLPALGRLAWASKAFWGYAPELLKSWSDQLTLTADQLDRWEVWLAESAESDEPLPLGFCALHTRAGGVAVLEHLWVEPEAIGQGVGSRLLQHAIEQARKAGATSIEIDADPHAERFYRERGAVRVAEIPAPIPQDPSRYLPRMLMNVAQADATLAD